MTCRNKWGFQTLERECAQNIYPALHCEYWNTECKWLPQRQAAKQEHLPPQPLVMLSAGLGRCPSSTKPLLCTFWCVLCPSEGPKSTNSSVHEQISSCTQVPFLILTPKSEYPHLENVLVFMPKVFTWTGWNIGLHWNVHALDAWILWKQWERMINLERKIGK